MFDGPVGGGVVAFLLPPRGLASPFRPGFIVAVPVKDEEERFAGLLARSRSSDRWIRTADPPGAGARRPFRQQLHRLECEPRSKAWSELAARYPVVEATLPPGAAHAGNARRAAMDIAEAWLLEGGEKDGVILTTDADSQVAPIGSPRISPPLRLALRRFSDASISIAKASSYPRRFINAASLRTLTKDCSPNSRACLTLSSTILGLITLQSPARALA